jgi:DNA-binding transcriptional LysR family regulator
MELRHLRYFAAIAKHLSFTRAAKELRVAQPALSRQLRQLEDELGVKLLERNQRSVALTIAGQAFLDEAQKVLRQSDEAVRVAKTSTHEPSAHLDLGYIWGLFHTITPAALAGLRQKWPDVTVNLFDMNAEEQRAALAAGKIDAGFIGFEQDTEGSGLARHRIGKSEFMLVLPDDHPLVAHDCVSLADLSRELFIAVSERTYPSAASCASDICLEGGFRPRILQAAERGYTVLALVAARCGVALLPASLAAMPHTGVEFRPLVQRPARELYIAWHRDRSSPLLEALLAELPRG